MSSDMNEVVGAVNTLNDERFAAFQLGYDKRLPDECWLWKGIAETAGYGVFRRGKGRSPLVHRISYELANGPIPHGLVVDHVCRNKKCVNPAHLRAVTIGVNTLENSVSITALNRVKTHCAHGHPYDAANTGYKPNGHRRCLACRKLESLKRHSKAA